MHRADRHADVWTVSTSSQVIRTMKAAKRERKLTLFRQPFLHDAEHSQAEIFFPIFHFKIFCLQCSLRQTDVHQCLRFHISCLISAAFHIIYSNYLT